MEKLVGICTKLNGWGLTYDFNVISSLINSEFIEYGKRPNRRYDLIIFSEMIDGRVFRSADKLATLINPEWYMWHYAPNRFHLNLAKTHYTKRLLEAEGYQNVVYTSFTTTDEFDPSVDKVNEFVHFAGNSTFKGTEAVLKAWLSRPSLPTLHLFNSYGVNYQKWVKDAKNIKYHHGRIDGGQLKTIRNRYRFAIQPSKSEGFGHCLWQPMSSKCLVVTTDAPPMNETGNFYVKAHHVGKHHRGDMFDVDPLDILTTVEKVLSLSQKDIVELGEHNRERYIENDHNFRIKFLEAINEQIR